MKAFVISRGMPSKDFPLYGIFEFDQAKALAKSGIDTSMLVIDFRSRAYKRKYGYFSYVKDDVKIFELSLPLNLYRRALPLLRALLFYLYKKAVKQTSRPDIIHAHFYSIAAIASIIKKKTGIPFVITEHSSKLNKDSIYISKLDKRLSIKGYSNADCIISVSNALSHYLKKNFGYDSIVIHDIVDTDHHYHTQQHDNKTFTFISVGNLIPLKGFDVLIKAFHKAFKSEKDVHLNIIGEGVERDNLQNIINEHDISDRVHLLGLKTRPELFELLQNSNAFVLASKSETFGVAYIEAMACRLPVIATLCGGPNDFVNDDNGILVPTNDIDSLSKALINMRLNINHYDKEKISKYCYDNFSPEIIAEKIKEQYNKVLNNLNTPK